MSKLKCPKIGLALGSGGAKGLAHIGVIKVLEKNNIPIDFIAGSSIGALIGGFYAATKNIKQIEKIALNTNWRQVFSLLDPSLRQGLIGGEKIEKFIEENIGQITFQDLKIHFSAMATDLKTGQTVVLNTGEVVSAIRASISLPLVFKPIKRGKKLLTDGGLSMPVPVETARKTGAELVIAVNLDADYFSNGQKNNFGFYRIANSTINLLRYHLSCWNVKDADVVIAPKIGNVQWHQFLNGQKIIFSGEEATRRLLPQLKKLIRQKSKPA
jgi:NTE family protein